MKKETVDLTPEDPKEEFILQNAKKVFMRFGIKSVTMDDIAREMKMSKKTLYKYVSDKSDLVCKVMDDDCLADKQMIEEITARSKDAIDEILMVAAHIVQKLQMVHPSIHYDLEKYYPEAWEVFYNHKRTFVFETMKMNILRGIKEGLYRENLNASVIAKIFAFRIDMVFDPEVFPPNEFSFQDVYLEGMRYHIRGIASEKGIKALTEKLKKEKIKLL